MKLILVRHGETENNHKGVYCGWNEGCLTEKGRIQAKEVSKKLEKENLNVIVSSDLNRTLQTAEMINKQHHVEIMLEKKLREMNFGAWEGLSYKEIKKKHPNELKEWEKDWIDTAPPDGESVRQMYERIVKAIDQMIYEYKDENILIVSHAGCIRAMLAYLIGRGIEDYWRYKIDNCGITVIEIVDDFAVLTALNQ